MNEDILNEAIGALTEQFPNLSIEGVDDNDECEIQISSQCTVVLSFDEGELHIRKLTSRGGGVGSAVVAALTEYAQENDITLVAKKVLPTAESFWDKMGFERVGLAEDFILV